MELHTRIIRGLTYIFLKEGELNLGKCIVDFSCGSEIFVKYYEIFPKYRGRRYGTSFWKILEERFAEQDVKTVYLIAEEFDERHGKLQRFYESLGFRVSNESRFCYNGDFLIRKIPMIKDL